MKKVLCLIAFVFCFSFIYASKADMFSGIPYKSATWKSETTVDSPQEKISFEQTVYLKGKKMRMEGTFQNRATNEKENQITIINEDFMYSINPDKKQGMKYSMKSLNNPINSEKETYKCRENAKKTGTDKINGVKCEKYEYACKTGSENVKIIEYRNNKGFAIKTISKMDRTTTTIEIKNLKINASVSDSKFTPDSNIKFMDMDNIMGGNLNKMMKPGEKPGNKNSKKNKEEDDGGEAAEKIMKDMMKGMLGN